MAKTKCPHCGGEFETIRDVLDAINMACGGGTPQNPEATVKGYRLWFRGYMLGMVNIDLIGLCVAYPPQEQFNKGRMMYVVVPAYGDAPLEVQHMARGQAVDIGYSSGRFTEAIMSDPNALDILVSAKKRAMQFLKEYVEKLPALYVQKSQEENTIGN